MPLRVVWFAALQLAFPAARAAHYVCTSGDEVKGEVQGETGVMCGPRCADSTFQCPADVPQGTLAQPQCMLQDVDQTSYCGLWCQSDSQCPSGASCRKISGSIEVSICIHPLSFDEWAKTAGDRRKLTVGWPAKAGQQASGGFQIARAYSALQSLKHRYGIADGDADVLTVKELLSAASTTGVGATARSGPGAPATAAGSHGGILDPWKHDLAEFGGNLAHGLPGLEKEAHDIVWSVEHIERAGVASTMLRSVIMAAFFYIVGGALYKNQAYGSTGIDMIPHVGFWREYPRLVADGVQYATGISIELFGKSAHGGFQPLSGGVPGRGDSFSQL